MFRHRLFVLNVVLIGTFLSLVLACGGDPQTPPPGSLEEKLCADWISQPISGPRNGEEKGAEIVEWHISFWNVGLVIFASKDVPERRSAAGFTVHRDNVTTDPKKSGDGSWWVLRIDPYDPNVMLVDWIMHGGTKAWDSVKFHTKRG